jgi:hypothetical protein
MLHNGSFDSMQQLPLLIARHLDITEVYAEVTHS